MTINENKQLMIVGYPKAGKTTFLAALWYVLNNTDESNCDLRLYKLEGNDIYLNMIQENWLLFKEIGRTNLSQETKIFFKIQNIQNGNVTGLSFPDLSGERFRQHFEERQCSNDFVDLVKQASGVLFFLHSGQCKKSILIDDTKSMICGLKEKGFDEENPESTLKTIPWDRTMPCIQVKSIELLQFISHLRNSDEPLRIAVVLSAWDLVNNLTISPVTFFKNRFPMIYQFLLSNSDQFSYEIFGISATGVDLDKDNNENIKKFASSIYNPADRIMVKIGDDNTDSHDLTLPIKWVL